MVIVSFLSHKIHSLPVTISIYFQDVWIMLYFLILTYNIRSNRLRFTHHLLRVDRLKKDVKMQERYGHDCGLSMTSYLKDFLRLQKKGVS